MGDSESDGEDDNNFALRNTKTTARRKILKGLKPHDLEEGIENDDMTLTTHKVDKSELEEEETTKPKTSSNYGTSTKDQESRRSSRTNLKVTSFQLPKVASTMASISNLEQSMPADAVLAKEGAAEVSKSFHQTKGLANEIFSLLVFARF